MTISTGDHVPDVAFTVMGESGPEPLSADDLFKGKKVVVFGVPGAYTPTCSAKHLPGFVDKAAAFTAKGVDTVACIAVNDAFVMGAWGKVNGTGGKVTMLADGSAAWTRAAGLELDLTARGLGVRCQRFAMIVDDGVVSTLNIEGPGAFEVSDADTVLAAV